MRLPDFCISDYDRLLSDLKDAGYSLRPVEDLASPQSGRVAFLRHDIDLHIPGVEKIAAVEARHGVSATYYVPLTLHFNPCYPENRMVLRRLVSDGHRIGLHYDLQTYPTDQSEAWEQLDREAQALSALVSADVRSICMHFPWEGREDLFVDTNRYVHPHNPRYALDMVYVSDSCRAWRDETLLGCFTDEAPRRLLLNTHPELWLGEAGTARDEFAYGTLLENTVRQHHSYVVDHMLPAWDAHPAPKLHDQRECGHEAA